MARRFQRTVEDFSCEHCGETTVGDGYTNHCPHCLWSKHVDIHPGDREASCEGLMRPVGVEIIRGEYYLLHRCERCGAERRNIRNKKDDTERIMELFEKQARGVI